MILTAQQKQAMIMIEKFIADKDSQVFILKGYAGTGKTTLIRSIADYLSTQSLHIQLMAPTGRAAKILRSKLPNYGASTIHRGIYNFSHLIVEESEGTLKYIFPLKDNHERCIYIIDEASMISSRESKNELFQFGTGVLIKDLLSYARLNFGGKVIFVGDPMQLPPVGDDCSVALDETYFDIQKVNKETALPNFNSGIVVVDDINIQKKLFYYTFGQGKIGGIVFFNDTDLRPEVGQCLKIFYCVTKDRKGEKRPIVLNVEETAEINTSAIKTIQGHLELKYKNGSWDDSPDFAFIGDYYVHHSVLCEYNITKDCYVTADVIYAGQGKWKVIKIHQ